MAPDPKTIIRDTSSPVNGVDIDHESQVEIGEALAQSIEDDTNMEIFNITPGG